MVCVHAKALNVDDDDAALARAEVVPTVDDAQAVDARGVVLVDDVREWTVPPAEH